MVFIQQKYEEALVDLYFYRAESSGARRGEDGNRPAVDEAIAGTYWVAQQNGVTYSEEQIQEKFMEQLNEQLVPNVKKVIHEYRNQPYSESIRESLPKLADAIRNYYLDPKLETFEAVIQLDYHIREEAYYNPRNFYNNFNYGFSSLIDKLLSDISDGLSRSFDNHGDRNKEKFQSLPINRRTKSNVRVQMTLAYSRLKGKYSRNREALKRALIQYGESDLPKKVEMNEREVRWFRTILYDDEIFNLFFEYIKQIKEDGDAYIEKNPLPTR
jgi:hypothetical protein